MILIFEKKPFLFSFQTLMNALAAHVRMEEIVSMESTDILVNVYLATVATTAIMVHIYFMSKIIWDI